MSDNRNSYQQSVKVPKPIIYTAKTLQWLSNDWAAAYGIRLFETPLKHKMPKREFHMDKESKQHLLKLPNSDKEIMAYHYGDSPKKVLLAHGWSGRGTQLVKFADALLEAGYSTVSFDAPAHGKAPGKTSNMVDFVEAIHLLEETYGPFDGAVGHSLGGMSLLYALRRGLSVHKLVTVGSGDIVTDIVDDFAKAISLRPEIAKLMVAKIEKRFGLKMNDFSASLSAKSVKHPVLVIHDKDDLDVPVSSAHHIRQNLDDGTLMLTEGLGHRRILGTPKVIEAAVEFLKN